jgi:TPR repeat protein
VRKHKINKSSDSNSMEVPGAFAKAKTVLEEEYGRRMQEALRRYGQVASLVDREVMGWHALDSEQQRDMDTVIETLNALSTTAGAGGVATEAAFVLGVLYQEGRGMPGPKCARAAECYQLAAEAGRTEALYNLACMTRTGFVVMNNSLILFRMSYSIVPVVHF